MNGLKAKVHKYICIHVCTLCEVPTGEYNSVAKREYLMPLTMTCVIFYFACFFFYFY